MRKSSIVVVPAGLVVCLAFVSSAFAVNQFYIDDQSVPIAGQGASDTFTVPVLADVDQDTYGFSVSLEYDQSSLSITDSTAGSAVEPLNAEYNGFTITPSPGRLVHGVVFDTSNPITKHLAPGDGQELLVLTVDILEDTAGTTVLNLVNVSGNPSRLNIMTNSDGDSVSPAPTLDGATITFTDARPVIQPPLFNNVGCAGDTFIVVGQNFDVSGFQVFVCGVPATAELVGVGGAQAQVTAPACGSTGWAEVEVCTDLGCDSVAEGFNYELACIPQPPEIQGFLNNTGCEGDQFIVVGQHFDEDGFGVRVCGVEADAQIIGQGGQQAQVTAPGCGSVGWADVEVYTDEGSDLVQGSAAGSQGFQYLSADICDPDPGGTFVRGNANNDSSVDISDAVGILNDLFLGVTAAAPCRDALDADDSGATDVTDAIYILNFLFQGGPSIPPPYPTAGTDPTADPLPECL